MKLLILDRDGVINQDSDAYIKTLDEWIPIPSSIAAIARLSQAGWTVTVATNQSGVARGKFDLSTLGDMHFKMQQLVMGQGGRIDLIVHCPHGPDDGCDCRKPKPGMFRTIAEHFGLADLKGVPVVGDSHRDLHAGMLLGGVILACVVLAFVVFFYCLGALYDDRRDRSILFWKSLPLSDTQTVLSKLISALVVAPAIAVIASGRGGSTMPVNPSSTRPARSSWSTPRARSRRRPTTSRPPATSVASCATGTFS